MLLRIERQHRVRAAVAEVNERCRRLVAMLFYAREKMPYTEIARCLEKIAERFGKI